MTDLHKILQLLAKGEVRFVIVGGVAASAHGSSYATFDLDLCYSREAANLSRVASTLAPYHPRLRGAPVGLPFLWDAQTLKQGLNFTLSTDLGDLNLLGKISGVGDFELAKKASVQMRLFGLECDVLSLDALIAAKRASGRPKDLLVLPELEALREALRGEKN